MRIEYVIIESKGKKKLNPSKRRIVSLMKGWFVNVTSNEIMIQGKRKMFEVSYQITCCSAMGNDSKDNIYNFEIKANHSDKKRCAELLEFAHNTLTENFTSQSGYYIVIANDGLSEYYCNRTYPKYQKFERQLRHLIFKVVTKAYGSLWTKQTIYSELKEKLKKDISSRSGVKKEDILIEQALHEMNMSQLIEYLFYGKNDFSMSDYLDEHYPVGKLESLSKEELIELIEKSRRQSVWNMFLANDIDIEEPRSKLNYLRTNRNKIAHCKEFHFEDYQKTSKYIEMFLPKIEKAIQRATVSNDISVRDIVLGFGDFTLNLANMALKIGETISPAIQKMAEVSTIVAKALNHNISAILNDRMLDILGKLSTINMTAFNVLNDQTQEIPLLLSENDEVEEDSAINEDTAEDDKE